MNYKFINEKTIFPSFLQYPEFLLHLPISQTGKMCIRDSLWNSRSHGRYPCVSDFEAARLGGGKESSGRGEGAGKGFAGGTLEPD